jgi:hypothetical protein
MEGGSVTELTVNPGKNEGVVTKIVWLHGSTKSDAGNH